MKPVALDDVTREGNLDGHQVFMSFDENSLAHLMKVMTDLYSDPALAVIREYSTNALDSHVEAGVKRPIEVSLPGALSPYFKVKDFGVGLNTQDVIDVYSKYGASTKRDTNTQVGMLGLGCKSALTFTQSFQVIGIKDGIKTHVMITRDSSGVGLMEIVDTSSTTEGNGVEVTIPCANFRAFNQKAHEFYKYWQKGTVLVNGKEPVHVVGKELADGVFERTRESDEYGSLGDVVVMGNVPYPVADNNRLWPFGRNGETTAVVAIVEIGSVAITPSREALYYNDHTKATLASIRKKISDQFQARMKKDIDGAADHAEAFERATKWRKIVGIYSNVTFTYKGETIPFGKAVHGRMAYHPYRARNAVAGNGQYGSSQNYGDDFVIVTDYTFVDIPTHRRVKMRKWAEDNGINARVFVIAPAGGFSADVTKWMRNKTVSWNVIKKVVVGGTGSNGKRSPKRPPHFFTVDANSGMSANDTELTEIAKSKKVCYYDPAETNVKDWNLWRLAAQGWTVVRLPASRVKVFETKVKSYIHFRPAIEQEAKALEAKVSDEDIRRYRAQGGSNGILGRLDPANLDDPDLKEYTLLKTSAPSTDFNTWHSFCQAMHEGHRVTTKVNSVKVKSHQDFVAKYPLLESFGYSYGMGKTHYRHIEFYLNEVHKKGSI